MAITGQMDLGIGMLMGSAYVRIADFWYRPEIPEIEFEIHNYDSKDARNLEIIKAYIVDYLKTNKLSDDKIAWLQTNVISKSVIPLQTMRFATCKIDGFPRDKATAIPFFYNWIKEHQVMGEIGNILNDMDTSENVIEKFKSSNPKIFE